MNPDVYGKLIETVKKVNMENVLSTILAFVENDSINILKKDIFIPFAKEIDLIQIGIDTCVAESKNGNIVVGRKKYIVNDLVFSAIEKAVSKLIKDEARAELRNAISEFDTARMSKRDRKELSDLATAIFGNSFYISLAFSDVTKNIVESEGLKNKYQDMEELVQDIILLGIIRQSKSYQAQILEQCVLYS